MEFELVFWKSDVVVVWWFIVDVEESEIKKFVVLWVVEKVKRKEGEGFCMICKGFIELDFYVLKWWWGLRDGSGRWKCLWESLD